MSKQIFVNLPVSDLKKAMAFYTAIGAVNNPQFTDDTAACMVFSESICVMLLTHGKWSGFTRKPITDAKRESEMMLAISCDSRQAVDKMTEAAAAHGGKPDINPKQEYPFMYGRSFEDTDGHVWEPMYMDMSQFPKN
jgi:predicted lactoylglutathione lyase